MMDGYKEASVESILDLLRSTYWKGVRREVCEAILAYQKIEHFHPDLSSYESDNRNSDLSSSNFEKFCALLSMRDLGAPYTPGADGFDSKVIHRKAIDQANMHLSIDIARRRARYLLQAIGLLDIDAVHDSMTKTTIGRSNHHPQGESITTSNGAVFFRETLCCVCKWPLRGYFYYECTKGCLSDPLNTDGSHIYVEDPKRNKIDRMQIPEEFRDEIFQLPFRLCPTCITDIKMFSGCKREHCEKKFTAGQTSKGLRRFESRLRDRESLKQVPGNGSDDHVVKRAVSWFVDPARYANAGAIHFALMFGPLLIENGVADSKGGALISCRPVPSMQFNAPKMQFILAEEDAEASSRNRSLVAYIFDHKELGSRVISRCERERRGGRFLGCAKKVVGGAFSGHEDTFADDEETIIAQFIQAKSALPLRMDISATDPVRHHRTKLQTLIEPVVKTIERAYSLEVDFYLKHFATVLADATNPLRWDLDTNNCQTFGTNLLKGLPIDKIIHSVPREWFTDETVRKKKDFPYPRYCLSFGHEIDTPIALLGPQWRSIIWNFYHKKRDYCDLIEFGEAFRKKSSAFSTKTWEVLDGIDDENVQDITLVDALWSIPRDAVSVLQTHLQRSASRYSTKEGKAISESEWYNNRLRVFHQLDVFLSLSAALARAIMEQAAEKRHLIPTAQIMHATIFNDFHASERLIRPLSGYRGLDFRSGREREWHKRQWPHTFKKLLAKVGQSATQVQRS